MEETNRDKGEGWNDCVCVCCDREESLLSVLTMPEHSVKVSLQAAIVA